MVKGVVIAGTASGSGKTSVTLGLLRALRRRGLAVQPFKAGPDFIDPGHHGRACGRESHNLDSWMCPPDIVRRTFAHAAADAEVAVVEGVMGLYDGAGATSAGSTAELAALLGLPVLLVLDCRSLAGSAAALAKGYVELDTRLAFAGLVPNKLGSPRHAELVRAALAHHLPEQRILGPLPRRPEINLDSRHLGLVTAQDAAALEPTLEALADWVEDNLDVDGLLAGLPEAPLSPPPPESFPAPDVRLGVARDEAFCFLYAENLRLLRLTGVEPVFFSPLRDTALPPDLDGLYLPGGYPELHGATLAANTGLKEDIRRLAQSGKPIYAECGGFMYLMEALVDANGHTHSMCSLFDFTVTMGGRRAALGYREVTLARDTILGPAGAMARGHEFHYSFLPTEAYAQATAYRSLDTSGGEHPEGFARGNVLGSYVHLHFGSNPALAANLAAACRMAR